MDQINLLIFLIDRLRLLTQAMDWQKECKLYCYFCLQFVLFHYSHTYSTVCSLWPFFSKFPLVAISLPMYSMQVKYTNTHTPTGTKHIYVTIYWKVNGPRKESELLMFDLYYWLVVATLVLLLEYVVCVSGGHEFILISHWIF